MAAKLASSPENCILTLYLNFRPFLSLRHLFSLSQTVSQFQRLLFFCFTHLLSPSHTFSFRYCFFSFSLSLQTLLFQTPSLTLRHLLSHWYRFSVSNCLLISYTFSLSDTTSEPFPIALSSGKIITHSKPKVFYSCKFSCYQTGTWMCFKVKWVQRRSPNINIGVEMNIFKFV